MIDIPIIYTVVSEFTDIVSRIEAGVDILDISGGEQTSQIIKKIRQDFPDFPIMATGGPTEETIREAIEVGANAITIIPPTNGELFKSKMKKYRKLAKEEMSNKEV